MIRVRRKEFDEESLYRLLTQKGEYIDVFSDDFSAIFLSEKEQEILKTSAQIGIKRIRRSSNQQGEILEYSEAIYHTDLHPYHIDYET